MATQLNAAPVIEARGITIGYPDAPRPVLEGFDLSVRAGEFVAIVGGSGVGKSTLLRVVGGLVAPERGSVAVTTPEAKDRRRRSIVFQDGRLMPWRTLRANVAYGLEGLKVAAAERDRRIDEVLRLTGLEAMADRYPHQLSGGQVQRGGIARALAVNPDILLMDEPFSAVDALTRESLQDEVLRIWGESGKAVLFVTHDIAEAAFLADRVIVLSGRPAGIALDRQIDLPRPRARGSAELAAHAAEIGAAL
ncbi:ABC transporter ATP-binding protein [Poseidonocella sp. HB161398]|uniref:ABC transporter ATP-binding protein n=1 Tax=Poseidonocella sp. HB161398 TaxID=2320855 RepID=UPI00110899D9|nr:ABC transporter ATP-binding protein [Poseidonocella sp. HB161398]